VMAWVMIPYTLTNTLAQILFASGNQAFDLKVNVIATVTSVLLNVALISRWGFVGAAFASLGTMILHVSLQYSFVRRHVYDPRMTQTFARIGAATLAGIVVLMAVRPWSPILAAGLGSVAYVAGIHLAGILTRAHVRRIVDEIATRLHRAPALETTGGSVRKEPA
jgi:O-antigen/teichoic acid export membrane protein